MIPEALLSSLLINKFTVVSKSQTFLLRSQYFKGKNQKNLFFWWSSLEGRCDVLLCDGEGEEGGVLRL